MSTLANVLEFARTQVQQDSNGITDANGIIFANEALLDFRRRLISSGVDAAQTQEAYASFTANTGTYLWPTDMWWLKALELNYVNTNDQDYKTASQVDVSNIPGNSSFSWLRKNADRNAPQFDDRGDWFEVFPTPTSSNNTTNAIRIFYFLEPTEYTSVSDTISYPESIDYRILGLYVAGSYYQSLSKFDEATFFFNKYDARVKDLIATLSRGTQMPVTATPLQIDGWLF